MSMIDRTATDKIVDNYIKAIDDLCEARGLSAGDQYAYRAGALESVIRNILANNVESAEYLLFQTKSLERFVVGYKSTANAA